MEVTQISPYNFNIAPRLRQVRPKVQDYVAINRISNICYQPIFTGTSSDEEKLKNIPDIKCACCGDDFVSKVEYKRLGSAEVTSTSTNNIQELLKFEHKMKPIEKQVFEVLKDYSQKLPQENFQELLQRANRKHLPRLEDCQSTILNSVRKDLNKMQPDSKIIINDALNKVSNILFNEPKNIPQKRYRSIQLFDNLFGPFIGRDKELMLFDEMCDKIISLPSSGQNVDAFIAKYAHRSSGEISQRLLIEALPTIEHVVATSNGGDDDINNKIILCKDCNKERSNYSYAVLLGNHPEMKENLQLYIDKVIEQINIGKLVGFEEYPLSIKEKLEDMQLELNLDISNLSVGKKWNFIALKPNPIKGKSEQLIALESRHKQNIEDFQMAHPILTEFVTGLGQSPKSVQEILSMFVLEEQKLEEAQLVIKQLEPKISHIEKQQEEDLQLKKLIYTQKVINRKISQLDTQDALEVEIAQKREQIDKMKKELPPTILSDEEIVEQYTKAKKYILNFDLSVKKARQELANGKNLEKYTVTEQLTRSDFESFKRDYPMLSKFATKAIKKNLSVKSLLIELEISEKRLEKSKKIITKLSQKYFEIKAQQYVKTFGPIIRLAQDELSNENNLQKYLSKKSLTADEFKEFQQKYPALVQLMTKVAEKPTSVSEIIELFRTKENELKCAKIVIDKIKKQSGGLSNGAQIDKAQKLDKINEINAIKRQLNELLKRKKNLRSEMMKYPDTLDKKALLTASSKLEGAILVAKNACQSKASANAKLLSQYLEKNNYIEKFGTQIISAKNEIRIQNKSEKYLQKETLLDNLISNESQPTMQSAKKDAKLQKLKEQLEQNTQTVEELSASIELRRQAVSNSADEKMKLEQNLLENSQAFKKEHPLFCAIFNNWERSNHVSIKKMLSQFSSKEINLKSAEDKKSKLEPEFVSAQNLQNLKAALDKLFEQKRMFEKQLRKLEKMSASQSEMLAVLKLHKNVKNSIELLKEKIRITKETTVENLEIIKQYIKIEKYIQAEEPRITAAKNELAVQNKLAQYMQKEGRIEQQLNEVQEKSDLSHLTALLDDAIAKRDELSAKIASLTT